MKADRTVIVFGVFIFLIGLAVAWNGYGYIEVERGWSMVISGTIAFSAGLILIALGLILRQLKFLSASAAQVALFLAKASQNGVAAQPVAPAEPAPEAEAMAEQEPVPEEAAPVEQAPAQAEEFAAPPPAWMRRASTYAAGFSAARVAEPDAAPADEVLDEDRDWLEKAVAEEIAAQQGSFREAAVHEAAEEAMAPEGAVHDVHPQDASDHEARAHEARAHESRAHEFPVEEEREETIAEPPLPSTDYGWENAVEDLIEEQEPQEIGALEHEPAAFLAPHEPEQVPEPAPEPHDEAAYEETEEPAPPSTPAILGQYDANGARYTMYVDGSIDAETAHGVYRFASMDELKRFLEQNA